ncbi:sigma-54 dependent transcriptional regulator [Bosea sp. (in: a-proteobacteria)]|uniref:sigma-54-dependent transcriptional regulator n=1 Tax=Bosea sp. (in: a-proteobacteria) TaxID=1871050 RepID=UPI0026383D60|nr:sigma-54 dependent transcriptional regulator [Bosea sp. (in: a-proteobacteria)]MCO5093180.1 sigma-54 dependent transcriptional regulator [Bosea sp. (in: a-proteobacteria)]
MSAPQIILVDDDAEVLEAWRLTLELEGFTVLARRSGDAALTGLARESAVVLVSDVRMPGRDGFGLLSAVTAIDAEIPVVLITGHADVPMAVKAIREGAWDFVEKPADPVRLIETIRRASEYRRLIIENRALKAGAAPEDPWAARLVGHSPAIARLRGRLALLAEADTDVLLFGETGTGKEVAARALHDLCSRRAGRFVAVNCGAIPETMIESELFGHEAGAFTGARERRIGKIEHASGGTLFLDEIESMPIAAQVRLLRALQERRIERLGSNKEIAVDIRIVAATKTDLAALARAGGFREDLVYRLNVVTLRLPPLRDRREDIPVLFQHFLALAAARIGRSAPPLGRDALQRLTRQDWPGNVRELRNAAERSLLGMDEDFEDADAGMAASGGAGRTLEEEVAIAEAAAIGAALKRHGGRIGVTAAALGITRKTLYLKMRRYGLNGSAALAD